MTKSRKHLAKLVVRFAEDKSSMLNRTVTTGVRLSVPRKTAAAPAISQIIAFRNSPVDVKLELGYKFGLDPTERYLVIEASTFTLLCEQYLDVEEEFGSFEYVRAPDNQYPAAHFQIRLQHQGVANMLSKCGRSHNQLGNIHYPLPGIACAHGLEDVIECLILEKLVLPHDNNCHAIIEDYRRPYRLQQFKQAVSESPQAAAEQLLDDGWRIVDRNGRGVIVPPDDGRSETQPSHD